MGLPGLPWFTTCLRAEMELHTAVTKGHQHTWAASCGPNTSSSLVRAKDPRQNLQRTGGNVTNVKRGEAASKTGWWSN